MCHQHFYSIRLVLNLGFYQTLCFQHNWYRNFLKLAPKEFPYCHQRSVGMNEHFGDFNEIFVAQIHIGFFGDTLGIFGGAISGWLYTS